MRDRDTWSLVVALLLVLALLILFFSTWHPWGR